MTQLLAVYRKRLKLDERGSIMPVMAALLLISTVGGALAVDLTRAYTLREQLQTAADSAALAAATMLPDTRKAEQIALAYVAKNMPDYGQILRREDITFGQWSSAAREMVAGDSNPNAVQVITRLAETNGNAITTLFSGILGTETMDISAKSTAGRGTASCVLALDPNADGALDLDGAANLEAYLCGIQVNSRSSSALRVQGNGSIAAGSICVSGGASLGGPGLINPDPVTYCPTSSDPLADLEPPDFGSCDHNNASFKKTFISLDPGVYCGGLDIGTKSEIMLNPGIYVIKDGAFSIESDGLVVGEGVAIYLTGPGAVLDFKAKSSVSLTAPSGGPLAGILFFQDRHFGGTHDWKSNVPNELHGTIYLPGGDLVSKSENAMTPINSCNVLIARSIAFQSKGGASIDLTADDCRSKLPSAVLGRVALLE